MNKNRSRRLRKKLYLGEFRILGFEFSCKLTDMSDAGVDDLLDRFVEKIEAIGLSFGGGVSAGEFSGFVTSAGRYDSPSLENCRQVEAWLNSQQGIAATKVGALQDANAD
jgi:uncharacterized protein YggL (DUF469 family)